MVCVSHTQAIPNQVPQLGTYTAGDEEDEQEEEDDSAQSVLSVQSEARTVRHKQESEACQRALRHVRAMIDARGSYPAAQFPDDSQVWQQQQQYQRLHLQQQNIQQHQQQLRLQQQRLEQQFGPQQHPQQHHHQQQHSQQHHYQQQQQCHPQQQYYEDNDDDPEIVDDLEGYETESNEDEIQNANNVFQIYQYNEIVRLKQEVVDLRAKLVQRDLKIIELQMESDGLRMNLASRRAPG